MSGKFRLYQNFICKCFYLIYFIWRNLIILYDDIREYRKLDNVFASTLIVFIYGITYNCHMNNDYLNSGAIK